MANRLILKRSSVAGKVPLATDLSVGEIAVNLADNKLYTKDGSGNVLHINQGAPVANGAIYENSKTITANYTITSGKNAMSAGPITINAGVTVTVPAGSTWNILGSI